MADTPEGEGVSLRKLYLAEIELYEKVTSPQKNTVNRGKNMGVTLTPRKEGNRWSLKIDIPIDVLKKWIEGKEGLKP